MSEILNVINSKGFYAATTVGTSMYPFLRNASDQVVIEPVLGELKKFDVVLYRLKNGKYVLHRIVSFDNDYLIIRGDNLLTNERVKKDEIIGKLCVVWRKSKRHYANSLYCKSFALIGICKYKYRIIKQKLIKLIMLIEKGEYANDDRQ